MDSRIGLVSSGVVVQIVNGVQHRAENFAGFVQVTQIERSRRVVFRLNRPKPRVQSLRGKELRV